MMREQRLRFWLEVCAAMLTGAAALLTLSWPDWIEAIFRVDPDRHSGALEWVIVVVLLTATAALSTLARAEWRRLAATH
jgi:hypothetical protein